MSSGDIGCFTPFRADGHLWMHGISRTLLNFDQAIKSATKTLMVFEGNADATTLYAGGIKTAAATCGTAFTVEHLELAIANGINEDCSRFDPYEASQKGTELFIAKFEQFGGRPGLEVEIIAMPGTSDPDAYVRAFGPDLKVGDLVWIPKLAKGRATVQSHRSGALRRVVSSAASL